MKAVLDTPSHSSKHAQWWNKVYGSGVQSIQIVYKLGKKNLNSDALSLNLQGTPAREQQEEIQVVQIMTSDTTDDLHHTFPCVGTISTLDSDISELLSTEPISCNSQTNDLETAQWTDPDFKDLIDFLANNNLPVDPTQANKVVAQAPLFALIDGILS